MSKSSHYKAVEIAGGFVVLNSEGCYVASWLALPGCDVSKFKSGVTDLVDSANRGHVAAPPED